MPQSTAAVSVSTIGTSPCACGSSGWGSATSQMPASAGSRNQTKTGRGCLPSSSQAPATTISGCAFCSTKTVTKSPWKSAFVKRMVAIADAPAPTATPAAKYLGPACQSERSAGIRSGSVSKTSTTCSPKTIVVADVVSERGLRISPSRPHIVAAMLISTTPGSLLTRSGIELSLAERVLETEQVLDGLAAADQACLAVRDEDRSGAGDRVVVRAHPERVGAGCRHGEQVAAARLGQRDAVDQDVARFAVLAAHGVRPGRFLGGAVREQRLVAGAVELRPGIVGHPAVDRDVGGGLGHPLDDADAVDREPGAADQRASGLEDHLGCRKVVQVPRVREPLEQRGHEVADRRRSLALDVLDPETAAEVHDLRLPAELGPAVGRKGAQPVDARPRRLRVEELRADVQVQPGDVQAGLLCLADRRERLSRRKPELGAVVRSPDRGMRVG